MHWQPRPERYPGTVTTTDLAIPMDDGVVLRGDLVQPVRADGTVVTRPLPVIITITAYNKSVLASGGLGGPGGGFPVPPGRPRPGRLAPGPPPPGGGGGGGRPP